MRWFSVVVAAVAVSGCMSAMPVKHDLTVCYFGEALAESCQNTEIGENQNLVCVDLTRDVEFEIQECHVQLKEPRRRLL